MFFLRRPTQRVEPMPITMSGVRMGERLLQIGVDDAALVGAMAAKVGLSGSAALVVEDEAAAARARAAAATAGALLDVHVAALDALPFEAGTLDVVVVHGMRGRVSALDAPALRALFDGVHRVLRHGGRVIVLEPGPREGLAAILHPARIDARYEAAGGSVRSLEAAGFRPVRLVGEREGYRFFEGLKT